MESRWKTLNLTFSVTIGNTFTHRRLNWGEPPVVGSHRRSCDTDSDTFCDRLGERVHERNVLVNAARICGIDDPNTQEAEVEESEVEEESANAMNVQGDPPGSSATSN